MTENNNQSNEPNAQLNKSQSLDIAKDLELQPKQRITEDTKKLLISLCKNLLEKRLRRLERRNDEQTKDLKFTDKIYKNLDSQATSLVKNMEETLKKKEAKKKEGSPRKLKVNLAKHPLASKSLPPGKKIRMRTEYNTIKPKEKKKININTSNYKTEYNIDKEKDKDSHARSKTFFYDKSIFSEGNIKKGG